MFYVYFRVILVILAINARCVYSVIGGDSVEIEDMDCMVSIVMKGEHKCGGAIIAKRWIVTAGHCILAAETAFEHDVQVRSGSSKRDSGGELRKAVKMIRHPKFSESTNDYDIGLIKVDPEFTYNNRTRPVDIPSHDEVKDDKWIFTCGWGYVEKQEPKLSESLECVYLPKIDKKECEDDYAGVLVLNPRQVCYGYREGGVDTCKGDSGGPAVNKYNQLIGITSVGNECASSNSPGMYTDVPLLKDWIMEHINKC